jgi:hypothetical protein
MNRVERLIATFRVEPLSPLLLRGSGDAWSVRSRVDGFDVELRITPNTGMRSKGKRERLWTESCAELEVVVARNERADPPEPLILPNGGRDYTVLTPYFDEREPAYRATAYKVTNNLISFFKYELRQPLLAPVSEHSNLFMNPEWADQAGNKIHGGRQRFVWPGIAGWRGDLGVRRFENKDVKKLSAALAAPRVVPIHEQILSDAQAAAFEGNGRRAVLELAVACEVFIKSTFLGRDARVARVYEALEDRGKINARVLDLIDIGGVAVMGTTFKAFDSAAHRDIDHLFRARNQAAHHGKVSYRDDAGLTHDVDFEVLKSWWISVEKLFEWAK